MWSGFFGGVIALACVPVQETRAGAFSAENSQTSERTGAAAILFYGGARREAQFSREVIRENKLNRSPFRAREGPDGTVAPATVFSGALGFRIGGVSLMPLPLVLTDAIMIGGGSTEIAMMMTAPSATHGFRKWAPKIAT